MSISFLSCKSFYSMTSILKGKNRSSNAHGMNKLCAKYCKIAPFYNRYTISSWHILWMLKNLVSVHPGPPWQMVHGQSVLFFFFIYVGVRASLLAPRLISRLTEHPGQGNSLPPLGYKSWCVKVSS